MRGLAILLGCTAVLAGCGGSGGSSGGGVPATPAPTPAPTPTPSPTPSPTPTSTATLTYLYSFGDKAPDAGQPDSTPIQASDGALYGTTLAGGNADCVVGCGAVYRVATSGEERLVYAFGASPTDGTRPSGSLIQGRDGALYGSTSAGGLYNAGTAFRLTLQGEYSVLHSFGANADDGVSPTGPLFQASDGNFYGTTGTGGTNYCRQQPGRANNCGTIFKMTPSGVVTTVYSFGGFAGDAVSGRGGVVEGADGAFYGTSVLGGAYTCDSGLIPYTCGAVFRVTPTGVATVLHSFGGEALDGLAPQGTLVIGRDGAFYGTTSSGGAGRCGSLYGCGTVFRITSLGAISILHRFAIDSRTDGFYPASRLIVGTDGNLYGTTIGGGDAGGGDLEGTVFRVTQSGVKTTLYSFSRLNQGPSSPAGGVVQGQDGAFYGALRYGYPDRGGVIYKLSLN